MPTSAAISEKATASGPRAVRLSRASIWQGVVTRIFRSPGRTALVFSRDPCQIGAMVSHISHLTIDARNAYELSCWWSEALDFHQDPDDPNLPGHEECLIMSADGNTKLLFIDVPDEKVVKNRLHLDLRPVEGGRDRELDRLLSLGATQLADRRTPEGRGWVVLADPEGNEFCILRSVAEAEANPWPDGTA